MNRYICGVDVANGDDYGVTIMVINKDGVTNCSQKSKKNYENI